MKGPGRENAGRGRVVLPDAAVGAGGGSDEAEGVLPGGANRAVRDRVEAAGAAGRVRAGGADLLVVGELGGGEQKQSRERHSQLTVQVVVPVDDVYLPVGHASQSLSAM